MEFSSDMIHGYVITYLKEMDGLPPMTAAQRAFGSLWFGHKHPTLIRSSHEVRIAVERCLMPGQKFPAERDQAKGFKFIGADWVDSDLLQGTLWIVMLNEANPLDHKLNGCYRYGG